MITSLIPLVLEARYKIVVKMIQKLLLETELEWLKKQNVVRIINVEKFVNALTNEVFLISTESGLQFIFKRLNRHARTDEDRNAELLVQQLASKQGLSATVLASNHSYKLQQYIAGDLIPTNINNLNEILATQFHRIHNLPVLHAPKQRLALELQRLRKQLPVDINEAIFAEMLELAKQLDNSSACDTLCHGDLSLNNVLFGHDNHYYILDWEYAVIACVAYDLAFCNCINNFSKVESNALIESYYNQLINQQNYTLQTLQNECELYLKFFIYINKLWALCFMDKG